MLLDGQVDCLRFSSFGEKELLACGTSCKTGSKLWNGSLVVFELEGESLKQLRTIGTEGGISCVDWLGTKGGVLVCAGDDASIHVWSLVSTKKDKPIRSLIGHDDIISFIATNPIDKESLLSCSWDLSVKLWGKQGEGCIGTLMGHNDLIWQVKWNALNGETFGSVSQDGTLKLWDCRTLQASTTVHTGISLFSLDWNPKNEHLFAIGGDDGLVQIYDQRNLQTPFFEDKLETHSVRNIAFNPHNETKLAVSSDPGKVFILDTESKTTRILTSQTSFVRGLSWSTKSQILAIGDWNKQVNILKTLP